MLRLLLPLVLAACVPATPTGALRRCDAEDPLVDCCESPDECLSYFGPEFPYCVDPGRQTGQCVECTTNEHCDLDSYCETGLPEVGPFCAPIPPEDGS